MRTRNTGTLNTFCFYNHLTPNRSENGFYQAFYSKQDEVSKYYKYI